jgi:hypothetical protein
VVKLSIEGHGIAVHIHMAFPGTRYQLKFDVGTDVLKTMDFIFFLSSKIDLA